MEIFKKLLGRKVVPKRNMSLPTDKFWLVSLNKIVGGIFQTKFYDTIDLLDGKYPALADQWVNQLMRLVDRYDNYKYLKLLNGVVTPKKKALLFIKDSDWFCVVHGRSSTLDFAFLLMNVEGTYTIVGIHPALYARRVKEGQEDVLERLLDLFLKKPESWMEVNVIGIST